MMSKISFILISLKCDFSEGDFSTLLRVRT